MDEQGRHLRVRQRHRERKEVPDEKLVDYTVARPGRWPEGAKRKA
jgi:hypothetical protein